MNPDISIIICSRNRREDLAKTLDSLEQQHAPPGSTIELLVVDNDSSDGTANLLRSHTTRLGTFRWVNEPTPGLAHARNRALAEAHGSILVWTDDDVRFQPDWLNNLVTPLLDNRADAVKGPVTLPAHYWEHIQGTPLERRLSWVAVDTNFSEAEPGLLIGANMAFHRRVLEHVREFDPALGAGPNSLGFAEETLFSIQMRYSGFRTIAAMDAVVEHHFGLQRLGVDRLLDIAERMGHSKAYMDIALRRRVPRFPSLKLARINSTFFLRTIAWLLVDRDTSSRDELRIRHRSSTGYLRGVRRFAA